MPFETETLDKLYLEWSQFTSAKTKKDLLLEDILEKITILRCLEDSDDDVDNVLGEIFLELEKIEHSIQSAVEN